MATTPSNTNTEKRNKSPLPGTTGMTAGTPASAAGTDAASTKSAPTTTKKKKPKKKKSTAKKSSTSNANAVNSLARTEYKKLLAKRRAKLHDKAWLSSGIPPVGGSDNKSSPSSSQNNITIDSPAFLDQDVEIVHRALQNNGLTMQDVTAEAFACLLQQARRYAMELITDAADYAVHSHESDCITPADLLLAREMMHGESELNDFSIENMDALAKIAHETNKRVLPPIPDHCYNGIVLPDPEYTLLGRAFDIVPKRMDADAPSGEEGSYSMGVHILDKGGKETRSMPSYGARRGQKQVQISLKPQRDEGMDIS